MIVPLNPRVTLDRKVDPSPARHLAACRRGDRGAWDAMVDQYGRLVYSIPRRYGLSEADADDVFQGVFLQLFRRLDAIRDPDRLSSWLITTAHRECWRVGKRSANVSAHGVDLEERIPDLAAPAAEDAEAWEQQHLVREALEQLGGRCQALLSALFTSGTTPNYEAIAQQLGMRVGSIGPTRARCFRKLEKILLELGVDVPDTALGRD
jgi:RNA polymerase sigma factor (sigma-70 family)